MADTDRRAANVDVIRRYFDAIATGDVEHLATFWAEDIVFEAPFSFTGTPSRTAGKTAVHARLSSSYGLVEMGFFITDIHELVDPDRFFVEYDSRGHMRGSGEPYENRYITMVELRDGLLTRFREFYDSRICAAAFADLLGDRG